MAKIFLTSFIVLLSSFNLRYAKQFMIDNVTYHTDHGYIQSYGLDESGLIENFDVHLASDPLTQNNEAVNYILLDLNTSNTGKLESGLYRYEHPTSKTRSSFTFNSVSLLINFNTETYSGQVHYAIDGLIQVKDINDQFLIQYELLMENGKEVIGEYYGQLQKWDQGM